MATVEVTPSSAELEALDAVQEFDATARDAGGDPVSGASVSWSVAPDSVASVDGSGVVTARANGTATVEASVSGVTGTADLTVDQAVEAVTVSPDSAVLDGIGATRQFEATAADVNGNVVGDASLEWAAEPDSVASVDADGTVAAEGPGTATVRASASGAADSATVTVRASAPSVTLEAHVAIEGSEGRERLQLADGESAELVWEVTGDPTDCRAGGAWSGSVACNSSGRMVTRALEGPGEYAFRLTVENAAGSASDTVVVDVAAPGERHARSDRRDDVSGEQMHLFYVVSGGGEDEEWDLDGTIRDSLRHVQDWLRGETDGREVVVDTYEGRPDITFVRLPYDAEEIRDSERVFVLIWKELRRRGFDSDGENEKKHIAYYDGPLGEKDGGGGARDPYGVVMYSGGGHALTALHELFHTLGIVDEDAPNFCDNSHVCDSAQDLMRGPSVEGKAFPKILDVGGDDYYAPDLPDELANLYDSPFITEP